MPFWWVNHKQTVRQEIGGGYIWSPKRKKNDQPSQYYDFMREVRPGDYIVSYAHAQIGHYGVVADTPLSAPKPKEFGKAGDGWANDGWLVPIAWQPVSTPFRPKDNIAAIAPLLPERYSPLQETGDGNQAAYLTRIDEALFEAIERLGGFGRQAGKVETDRDDQAFIDIIEDQVQEQIRTERMIENTDVEVVITARRGQGLFRKNVELWESACRISGLRDKRLLIASHIKPWRICESNVERLDGSNGLLLAPHIDRLFDRGLITFDSDGTIQISSSLDAHTQACLGLRGAVGRGAGDFTEAQEIYLAYHRTQVFVG